MRVRSDRNVFGVSFLQGFLAAIFFSYPGPPFYLFSFILLVLGVLFYLMQGSRRPRPDVFILILISLYAGNAIFSTLINSEYFIQRGVSLVGTVFCISLFYYGALILNYRNFWRGHVFCSGWLAMLVIALFLLSESYRYGAKLFVLPEYRLWGQGYFFDWPNYTFMPLIISLFVRRIYRERISVVDICMAFACVITTSRVAILGVLVFAFCFMSIEKQAWLIVVGLVFIAIFPLVAPYVDTALLVDRATKISDREHLFSGLVNAWLMSPVWGWGSVKVSDVFPDTFYDSFHNSYLEVLVKTGLMGLFLYILMLGYLVFRPALERHLRWDRGFAYFYLAAFFLLFASMVQNYLKHPHIIIIFSVLCYSVRVSGAEIAMRR